MKAWLAGTHQAPVVTTCIQGESCRLTPSHPTPTSRHPPRSASALTPDGGLRATTLLQLTQGWGPTKEMHFKGLMTWKQQVAWAFLPPCIYYVCLRSQLEWKESLNHQFRFNSVSPFLSFFILDSKAEEIGTDSWSFLISAKSKALICNLSFLMFLQVGRKYKRKRKMQQRNG